MPAFSNRVRRTVFALIAACSALGVVSTSSCVTDEKGDLDVDASIIVFIAIVMGLGAKGAADTTQVLEWEKANPKWLRRTTLPPGYVMVGSEAVSIVAGASVVPLRSVSPSGPLAPQAATAVADSTVVALFTGGAGTGAALATKASFLHTADSTILLQMTAARIEHAISVISGQRVLVTGGYGATIPTPVLGSAEIFSLTTRSFTATGAMRSARGDHATATLADGRVLVTGGLTPIGAGPVTTDVATTEIYNPATGAFTDGPAMTTTRFNHCAITLNDGRVLVLGGNNRRTAEVYSPTTNTFTRVGDMGVVHGNGTRCVKLIGGKVLVLGGDLSVVQPTATAELFDPATNAFTPAGNMTTARMLHFAALLPDGSVVIGGGRGPDGSDLATAEVYTPSTGTFARTADLPRAISDMPAAFAMGTRKKVR